MSTRKFRTFTTEDTGKVDAGTPVEVQAGWDDPLGYLYLCVYRLDGIEGEDVETLYSNLDNDDPAENVRSVQSRLEEFGIHWPPKWMELLRKDMGGSVKPHSVGFGVLDPPPSTFLVRRKVVCLEEVAVQAQTEGDARMQAQDPHTGAPDWRQPERTVELTEVRRRE